MREKQLKIPIAMAAAWSPNGHSNIEFDATSYAIPPQPLAHLLGLARHLPRSISYPDPPLAAAAARGGRFAPPVDSLDTVMATPAAIRGLEEENDWLRREVNRLTKFERLAFIDELTRLYNRRCFEQRLSEEWSRTLRHRTPLALLIADVDNLKIINDYGGHRLGDEVLEWVGCVLAKTCRRYDVPCRLGGDEFAIILPNTTRRGAEAVLNRLRENQQLSPYRPDFPSEYSVGLSIGYAVMPNDALRAADLFARADAAMYTDKRRRKSLAKRVE